jgi:hypothetical protein
MVAEVKQIACAHVQPVIKSVELLMDELTFHNASTEAQTWTQVWCVVQHH